MSHKHKKKLARILLAASSFSCRVPCGSLEPSRLSSSSFFICHSILIAGYDVLKKVFGKNKSRVKSLSVTIF